MHGMAWQQSRSRHIHDRTEQNRDMDIGLSSSRLYLPAAVVECHACIRLACCTSSAVGARAAVGTKKASVELTVNSTHTLHIGFLLCLIS
jgi:hypothetical protein